MGTASDIHWEDYEELVKDIFLALGSTSGVAIECWGRSCKVEGPAGVFNQVDVLANHSDGLLLYRTAISCKYWADRVGVKEVRDLAQVVQDARLNKGVMVSKMGFTKPALDLAAAKDISLVELRRPLDKDLQGVMREVHIRVVGEPQPRLYDVRMILAPDANGDTPEQIALAINVQELFVDGPDRERASVAHIVEKTLQDENRDDYEISFPETSVLSVPADPYHVLHGKTIKSISFKVEYPPPVESKSVVRLEDHVYMIMESIFDGRRFTITAEGKIVEAPRAGHSAVETTQGE